MKDIKVPYLPRITFEQSKEIAGSFLKQNNFWGKALPTNVEVLAHKSGHPVETFRDLRNHFDCKGSAWYNDLEDRLEIYIDADHYDNQSKSCQFTIAEELAHIILHAEIFTQIKTPEDRLTLDRNTKESTHIVIEKQAKQVASELLLPTDLFYPFVCDWFEYNLKNILTERPANETDLIDFISRKIGDRLGLNDIVIKRALLRQFDEMIIPNLVSEHSVKYLENILPNRIRFKDSN